MSSVRFAVRGVALTATLAGLSGCVTTMQENARTLLLNQRALASESAVKVSSENPSVRVLGVSFVRAPGGAALTVELANQAATPLTDLPISVGVRTRAGRRVYLNAGAGGAYYSSHIAAIAPRARTSWVYTVRGLPRGAARPFALVGRPHLPASTTVGKLPAVTATVRGLERNVARVSVLNRSGIPQYGLQVYAIALDGNRAVGAARGTVSELAGGANTTVSLRLVGRAAGAQIHVYVLPTIFA